MDRFNGKDSSSKPLRISELHPKAAALELPPFDEIAGSFIRLLTAVGWLAAEWGWSELVLRAGWLPHPSIPPGLIFEARDLEDADQRLKIHFSQNWQRVSGALRQSVQKSAPDADAIDAFEQALQAHVMGLFRAPPLLLFPQIEKAAREKLMPGALGANPADPLREAVGNLGPSGFVMPGVSGLRLYEKLANHLYRPIYTQDDVDAAQADPVPNRHAAMHGRVNYASEKSSLNMLIMTDFIFDALSKAPPPRS